MNFVLPKKKIYKLKLNQYINKKIPNHNRSMYVGEQQQVFEKRPRNRFYKPKVKFDPNLVNHKSLIHKLNNELNNYKVN